MQERGVQIVNVHAIFDGPQAQLVGRADHLPAADAAAGHPHREAGRVVVAAVAFFAHRRAAEFAAPDHQRFVEQTAPLQIAQQPGDRLVHRAAELAVVLLELAVRVPLAAGAVIELHEADAALDQPPGQQAVAAHRRPSPCRRGRRAAAVASLSSARSTAPGRLGLHAEGELVAGDAGFELGLLGLRGAHTRR